MSSRTFDAISRAKDISVLGLKGLGWLPRRVILSDTGTLRDQLAFPNDSSLMVTQSFSSMGVPSVRRSVRVSMIRSPSVTTPSESMNSCSGNLSMRSRWLSGLTLTQAHGSTDLSAGADEKPDICQKLSLSQLLRKIFLV